VALQLLINIESRYRKWKKTWSSTLLTPSILISLLLDDFFERYLVVAFFNMLIIYLENYSICRGLPMRKPLMLKN